MAVKKGHEMAIADITLFTITTSEETPRELGLKTATKIQIDTEFEEKEDIDLIIKGEVVGKKRGEKTITGTTLKLSDNVFNPELLQVVQGGQITYDDDGNFKKYTSPIIGEEYKPVIFTANAYSAQYDTTGLVKSYIKHVYTNCTGSPISFNAQDDTFFAPEYTIKSAPAKGESTMNIERIEVDELPVLGNADWLNSD